LEWIDAGPNEQGVSGYWDAWATTEESGDNLYRVVATKVPDDVPQGEGLTVPVEFTGYFFKRQGYESRGGFHTAPLLIAKRIDRALEPTASPVVSDTGMVSLVVGFALTVALALGITVWRFTASDRKFGDRHVRAFIEATARDEEGLKNVVAEDPSEALRRLAEQEES
jgi:hypothetical protein